jgi:hypothetical protein
VRNATGRSGELWDDVAKDIDGWGALAHGTVTTPIQICMYR